MKRMMRLLLAFVVLTATAFSVLSAGAYNGALTLTVPAGTKLTLYSGLKGGDEQTPAKTEEKGETVDYVFTGLESGSYRYVVKGKEYYTLSKQISYSSGETKTLNIDPGKHSGKVRYDPRNTIIEYTDVVMNGPLASSQEMFSKYKDIFTTPAFKDTEGRARHQTTTQEEMEAFIASLDGADDHMYVYTLGQSPKYHYAIPLVVFTKRDLTGAATIAEAAEILKKDATKPLIQYTAQIHGNEPAAGEGALAMIQSLDGEYGESVLDAVNIYVLPRVNPDGAYMFRRNNVTPGIDLNRDGIYQQAIESELVHSAYNAFLPHVAIDGHEFRHNAAKSGQLNDVLISFYDNLNLSDEHNSLMRAMNLAATDSVTAAGLRPYYYSSNAVNVSGRSYYQNYGSLGFLVETRGIGCGKLFYERRVVGQYASVKAYIDYAAKNGKTIINTVNATRTAFKESGKTYSRDNRVVRKSARMKTTWLKLLENIKYTYSNGIMSSRTKPAFRYAYKADESRQIATAYLIPAGEEYSEKALAVIRRNGLDSYYLEKNTTVNLTQYGVCEENVTVSREKPVTFANGAYVVPANQFGSRVLALLMEPYIADCKGLNASLVMAGVITEQNGEYPIYRYEHDLEPDGKIKTVPAR